MNLLVDPVYLLVEPVYLLVNPGLEHECVPEVDALRIALEVGEVAVGGDEQLEVAGRGFGQGAVHGLRLHLHHLPLCRGARCRARGGGCRRRGTGRRDRLLVRPAGKKRENVRFCLEAGSGFATHTHTHTGKHAAKRKLFGHFSPLTKKDGQDAPFLW